MMVWPVVIAVFIVVVSIHVLSKNGEQKSVQKRKNSGVRYYRYTNPDGTEGIHAVHDWKLQETWEDYPSCNYDIRHTYCSVAFDGSGRTYYYRTRNPELRVGDLVYAPVGYNYEKKIGRIVDMRSYHGSQVPYPLARTRYLGGKAE